MNVSTRNGALAAILAGLAYLIESIMGVVKPQPDVFSSTSDYVLEAVFVLALVATVFALLGLHAFASGRYGKAGTLGCWATAIGTGLTALSAIATLLAGKNSLGLAFLAGVLLTLIGYIVLGISTVRSKVFSVWHGLALGIGFPLSLLLSGFGGGILFGLAWLMVGYFLLVQSLSGSENAYAGKTG